MRRNPRLSVPKGETATGKKSATRQFIVSCINMDSTAELRGKGHLSAGRTEKTESDLQKSNYKGSRILE